MADTWTMDKCGDTPRLAPGIRMTRSGGITKGTPTCQRPAGHDRLHRGGGWVWSLDGSAMRFATRLARVVDALNGKDAL